MKRLLQLRKAGMRPKDVLRSVCLALLFITPGSLWADEVTLPKFESSPVTNNGLVRIRAYSNTNYYLFSTIDKACAQSGLFKVLDDVYKNESKTTLGNRWKEIEKITIADGSVLNYADVIVLHYLTGKDLSQNFISVGSATEGTMSNLYLGDGISFCKETLKLGIIHGIMAGTNYCGYYQENKRDGYKVTIPDHAFRSSNLQQVRFPLDIESIGEYAFANNKFQSVNLANRTKLKNIAKCAFFDNKSYAMVIDLSGCSALQVIGERGFNAAIKTINFEGCTNLTEIGYGAIEYCTNTEITCIDLSPCTSLKKIGGACFGYYTKLETVIIPPSVSEIGKEAFAYNSGLKSIVLLCNEVPSFEEDSYSCVFKTYNNFTHLYVPLKMANEWRNNSEVNKSSYNHAKDDFGPRVFPLLTPGTEWSTLSYWRPLDLSNVTGLNDPEKKLEFYAVTDYTEGKPVTIERLTGEVATGEGVLVKCSDIDATEYYAIPEGSSTSTAVSNNLLVSKNSLSNDIKNGRDLTTAWNISDAESHKYYLLNSGTFYRMSNEADFPAWRAFLNLDDVELAKNHEMMFAFDWQEQESNATGISTVAQKQESAQPWYSLTGTRMQQRPSKPGIYVHGGKKIVIK